MDSQANSVNAVPPADNARTMSGNDNQAQPSSNTLPSSPTRQLSGNTPLDNRQAVIQPSPIQPDFGSAPGSRGGTPQLHHMQSLNQAQNQSNTNMGMHCNLDNNRWHPQWATLPLSTMPQNHMNETDPATRQTQETLLNMQNAVNSHVGTPINQPSLNSLVPPRGRSGQSGFNTGTLDSTMFVGSNNNRQKTDNRDPPAASQSFNGGSRINLGWASGGNQGSSWQPSSANISPVVAGTIRSTGQAVGVPQNLSGGTSSVSSRHNSPTANTNSGSGNPSWPDVHSAANQLQQQRSSISHGGLLGMMANHPASGHPTPLSSPLATQQPLLGSGHPAQQQYQPQQQHQLNPEINMMQAMGYNMIRNGKEAELSRRQSATGTLDHSSGSNTPLTSGALSGSNLTFPALSSQYSMNAPGMGMAPRPFNMPQSQVTDGHFAQPYAFGGPTHNTLPGSGMTSPINPLGLAFGQHHPGTVAYQQGFGQPSSANQHYSQGLPQAPQSIMTGHNLGMPILRASLSLPGSPALSSAKSLDNPFHGSSQGAHYQHQPHVHSNLANKVNFDISPDAPLQPKLEPQDIEMRSISTVRTGSKSAPTSRQGTPLLVAVGLDEGGHGTKRSSSGSRKKEKERGEPVYSYSGTQPTAGARIAVDPGGKILGLNSDVPLEDYEQDSREDRQLDRLDHRKRKRNRTIQSCLPCHQNKRKCDRKKPCSRCKTLGLVSQHTHVDGPHV